MMQDENRQTCPISSYLSISIFLVPDQISIKCEYNLANSFSRRFENNFKVCVCFKHTALFCVQS